MALSNPISIFGIHSMTPYNTTTRQPFGELRVLESSSLSLQGELIDLLGGSNKYPWESQDGNITAEMSLSFSEYPDFVYELFLGTAPTSFSAETSGNVSTLTDQSGTVVNATTGIASVSLVSSEQADLKFGKYTVVVTAATTVDVYYSSDYDIARGTNEDFEDDTLSVATGLVIPDSGGTIAIGDFGLEFTGGSGTVNLETAGAVGDTATFEVRPVNTGGMTVKIGSTSSSEFPEFGAWLYAQRKSNELFEIDCFKCKALGMPISFNRNAYSAAEITVKVLYDSARDGVFEVRRVKV